MTKEERDKEFYDIILSNIRKGIYKFRDVGPKVWKKEYEEIFLKEIEEGTATDIVKKALIDYKIDQLNKQQISFDDISPLIKDEVIKQINSNK